MRGLRIWIAALMSACTLAAHAAADLDVNTPAIQALTQSMRARTGKLAEYYGSGAVGFAADGLITVRDPSLVPLPKRQEVNRLVAEENQDRTTLYREIAQANKHPEWEADIRATFAQRWIERAQPGWWVQRADGWKKK